MQIADQQRACTDERQKCSARRSAGLYELYCIPIAVDGRTVSIVEPSFAEQRATVEVSAVIDTLRLPETQYECSKYVTISKLLSSFTQSTRLIVTNVP